MFPDPIWCNMRKYKGIIPSLVNTWGNHKISHSIAAILYDFGVQTVKPSVHFIGGRKDIAHLDMWMTSFTCEPGIKVLVGKEKTPLLWAILKDLNIQYSGGASDKHMQASFLDSHMLGYKVKGQSATELISSICLYFQAIKEFHE